MEKRQLGGTGLQVSVMGFGGAEIGYEQQDVGDEAIGRLLNTVLDLGITLIDTAECYGESEELIGRYIGHRRGEFTLATKIGHDVIPGGGPEWSVPLLEATVDRGLQRLRTDCVDLIQLHSCSLENLERGEVIDVLVRARDAGKTRFIGYSGDNAAARYAVESGAFDSIQTSFNILDQDARRGLIPAAVEHGMGIIAKRPIANGMLRAVQPWSEYSKPYWDRDQKIVWPDYDMEPVELSLRFTLSHPVSCAITGSKNVKHIEDNIRYAQKGPLPPDLVRALIAAYDRADKRWEQKT